MSTGRLVDRAPDRSPRTKRRGRGFAPAAARRLGRVRTVCRSAAVSLTLHCVTQWGVQPGTGAPFYTARRLPRGSAGILLLLVEVAAFVVSTLPGVRDGDVFSPLFDGWLQGMGYVTAAALALLRPLTRAADREIWPWFAAAVAARALGFVVYLAAVRRQSRRPTPRSRTRAGWRCTC